MGCVRGRKERRESNEGEDRVEATAFGLDAKMQLGFPVILACPVAVRHLYGGGLVML